MVLTLSTAVTIFASATDMYTSGMYTYTVSDGQATITAVSDSISGRVTIPSKLGGYPVTGIGDGAFANKLSIQELNIPNTVISIGHGAFESCKRLANLIIGSKVSSVGERAFIDCSGLKTVAIPDSVTNIGSAAFSAAVLPFFGFILCVFTGLHAPPLLAIHRMR